MGPFWDRQRGNRDSNNLGVKNYMKGEVIVSDHAFETIDVILAALSRYIVATFKPIASIQFQKGQHHDRSTGKD